MHKERAAQDAPACRTDSFLCRRRYELDSSRQTGTFRGRGQSDLQNPLPAMSVARIGNGRVSRLRVPHSRSWSGHPEQDQDGDRALPSSDLVRKCPAIASQLRRTRRSLPAQAHAARNGSTR